MLLLVGGNAGADERFVDPKLLEWLRSSVAPWRASGGRLLLECSGLDCCVFVKDGGRSSRPKGGVALALDPVLKKLGGLFRSMFFIRLDPVLRGWWLLRLVNASWLGVSSAPMSGSTAGAPFLRQRRRFVLNSYGDGRLQQYTSCIFLTFCCLYLYQPCTMILINTSNVCLQAYIVKKAISFSITICVSLVQCTQTFIRKS
jgi:hypothetical protein